MEPFSVLAIINASLGIARSLVHTVNELYALAEQYETAALGIRTVATQCNSFRIAIERINKWLRTQNDDTKYDLDEDFWQALASNLETGQMVIDDLERRIQGMKKSPAKFWTRTKYLWNGVVIAELQSQIQGLMAAVSILIQVIDIPTTGGKRSQSRAQSTRLNGLTVSTRKKVRDLHQRQEKEDVLVDVKAAELESLPTSPVSDYSAQAEKELIDTALQPQDSAPPPYEDSSSVLNKRPVPTSTNSATEDIPTNTSQTGTSTEGTSFKLLDRSSVKEISPERKSKRPSWYKFMRRSSKQNSIRSMSDNSDNSKGDNDIPTSTTLEPSDGKDYKQATPAAVGSLAGQDRSFNIASAMSDMTMDSVAEAPDTSPGKHTISQTNPFASLTSDPSIPAVAPSPETKSPSNNPYRSMPLEAQTRLPTDSSKVPDYRAAHTDSANAFDRIRPSQIVREGGSGPQGPISAAQSPATSSQTDTDPLSRQSTASSRLNSINFISSDTSHQIWQTASITNRPIRINVEVEKESFTNRISLPAARALGVEGAVIEIAGMPMTYVTLLYTVSDGESSEANTVLGDEAEFILMSEHESRKPLLILGAGFAHFAQVLEEGQYLYWNPGSVPEKLRTVDRLRLYRRFELVRW